MLPTIKSLLDVAAPKRTQDTETEELVNLLLANFDASTVKGLNGQGKEGDALWELYKQVLRAYFSTGEYARERVCHGAMDLHPRPFIRRTKIYPSDTCEYFAPEYFLWFAIRAPG